MTVNAPGARHVALDAECIQRPARESMFRRGTGVDR
jgi:hypothetical protein